MLQPRCRLTIATSSEALADALQKIALDRALGALGLPPKYQTGTIEPNPVKAREWLSFARGMVERRLFPAIRSIPSSFRLKCWGICRPSKVVSQVNSVTICSRY